MLVVVWIGAVIGLVVFSTIPHLLIAADNSDKFLHAFAYCAISIIPFITFKSHKLRFMAALFLLFIGILNEFLQGIIGGRSPGIDDVVANSIGIIAGGVVSYLLYTGWMAKPKT